MYLRVIIFSLFKKAYTFIACNRTVIVFIKSDYEIFMIYSFYLLPITLLNKLKLGQG